MTAIRRGTVMLGAVAATGLLLSGCAIGVSAGANVSVTDRQQARDHHEPERDPYQSASVVAAQSAAAVAQPK